MKNLRLALPVLLGCVGVLSACAVSPQLSEAPADPPPRLVAETQRDLNGRVVYQWDRPSAFAKAVGERKVLGDAVCLMGRPDLEALGYHPLAKDPDGRQIPGGGYLCVPKAGGDKPADVGPRLVRTRGVLGWDQPSAFGAVPPAHQSRGDAVCAKAQPGYEAAGYHPAAKNEDGSPIMGGGFFCAPKRNDARALV